MVYGDFTSVKSAIASSAASNSGPVSRLPWAGSALMTASQLLASSRPASTGAAWAVEDLDHVGQRDQPGGKEDLLAPGALGDAFAVPALEGLLDAVPDPLGQAQPLAEAIGRQPVVLDHGLGHPAAGTRRDAEG